MDFCGVIAEYNPFHEGHAHQLRVLKQDLGFQGVLVCMSGDFTQRGEPAILPKELRAKAALENGADLVLELPVLYATGSAESFASGAVGLLESMGILKSLAFGMENPDSSLLEELCEKLVALEEESGYHERLLALTGRGFSFPSARMKLLEENGVSPETLALFFSPNNLLALEYAKALRKRRGTLSLCPIPRKGSRHDAAGLEPGLYPSASAIRNVLRNAEGTDLRLLSSFLPEAMMEALTEARPGGLEDYAKELKYLITRSDARELSGILDISPDLGDKMKKKLNAFNSCESYLEALKSRDLTYTRLSRALVHLLLDIRKKDYLELSRRALTPYARILAMKKDSPLVSALRASSLPRFTNLRKFLHGRKDPDARALLALDRRAEEIYALNRKGPERTGRPVIL